MNLFVLIDTIHNIANLIPLMENIKDKNSDVIIVITEKPVEKNINLQNLKNILEKKKIKNIVISTHYEFQEELKKYISDDLENLYFIINGGKKIQFLEVYFTITNLLKNKPIILLYSLIKPCQYYSVDSYYNNKSYQYFSKHGVDLKEILFLKNYKLNYDKSTCIFPNNQKIDTTSFSIIQKEIKDFLNNFNSLLKEKFNLGGKIKEIIIKIFSKENKYSFGEKFEELTVKRLLYFMDKHPDYKKIIQSIWKNVYVSNSNKQDNYQAEFDIIIVLKNGILLYIECKSGLLQQKDIDAKFANLQKTSSLFSSMIVTFPILSLKNDSYEEYLKNYNKKIIEIEKNLKNKNYDFLPFTEFEKGVHFYLENKEYSYLSFEEALKNLLNQWLQTNP
jgi:hypothetical protein